MSEPTPRLTVVRETEQMIVRQAFREALKLRHADLPVYLKLSAAARLFDDASRRARYVAGL